MMANSAEIENLEIYKKGANADATQDSKHHVSERVKFYEENIKESPSTPNKKLQTNSNNNLLLVPIGILIVLFTLYLAAAAFQSNYINSKEQQNNKNDDESIVLKEKQQAQEAAERIKILEKLLEYKDLCTELEVFTKDLRLLSELIKKDDCSKESVSEVVESPEDDYCSGDEEEQLRLLQQQHQQPLDTDSQNVNKVNPIKRLTHRNVQRRFSKVTSSASNKIKSESSKNISDNNNNKKDLTTAKKSNTAEPIIYLFALVFIYLLVKAASDINQHYKSQNKGDKRLRRCSLQSYAQTHKQDRRSSKGSPKRNHAKELLMKMRSNSVDRSNENIVKKSKILVNLRKHISLDEQNRVTNMPYGVHGVPVVCKTNNNEETALNNTDGFMAKFRSRRCSVPVSLHFQRHKLNPIPLVPANPMVARRTSLTGLHMEPHISGIQFPEHRQEGQFHEVKRRVRMINRH